MFVSLFLHNFTFVPPEFKRDRKRKEKTVEMSLVDMNKIAPLESPLPPPPEGEYLTESQWTTLMAIAETIIPSIQVSSSPSAHKLSIEGAEHATAIDKVKQSLSNTVDERIPRAYLEESASSIPDFKKSLHRTLGSYLREDARKSIRVFLSTLE